MNNDTDAIRQARHEAYAEGYADGKAYVTQAAVIYRVRHTDGRWRTLDSMGMPDFTDDKSKALGFTLREHADLFSQDDPEDVRIIATPYTELP